MKKGLLLVGLTSVLGVAGLASCGGDSTTNKTILTKQQSLSMQAATSLSMLSSNTSAKALRMAKKMEAKASITEEEKADIIKILPTLDLMLENSSSFESSVKTGEFKPVSEDDTLVFNTEEMIKFKDTDGKDVTYYLYYVNEKVTPAPDTNAGTPETGTPDTDAGTPETGAPDTDKGTPETGTPESGSPETGDKEGESTETTGPAKAAEALDSEDEDDEDDEEEDEKEAGKVEIEESIKGLATTDKATFYNFTSKVEKETSKDETEEERTFKIETGENSYIQVKQEHEVEGNEVETEFKYKVVENGAVTLEYAIEIENEDNQVELGYEIGGKEYELRKEIVKENDIDVTYYHVEYENEEADTEALIKFKKVTKENGEVEYEIQA